MSQYPDDEIDQGPAWGWGWLSEAAKAAKSAYDANVKPALDSMEATTSQFVQEVANAIELPEEEMLNASEEQEPISKSPQSSYPTDQVQHELDTTEEPQDDSLFGDALGGIAYLGGMVKKLGAQLGDVDSMEESFKKGGQKLKSAWEDAYNFITEDEEIQRHPATPARPSTAQAPFTPSKDLSSSAVPSTPSQFPSTPSGATLNASSSAAPTSASPAPRASLASPTFASLFEAKMGAVDLASLENMSMHASLQLQQMLRKMDEAQRATVVQQQEELRGIFAVDVLSNGDSPLDLATLQLPEANTEGDVPTREKFHTQLQALHQKLSFYASRTASLQAFSLKALSECTVPENGDIQALSEGTLNYRGKMQLEALRQLAEFTALAVHQILLIAEHAKEHYMKNPQMDVVAHAKLTHALALTTKQFAWDIASQIVASMKALGNSFKEKAAATGAQHEGTAQTVPSTLKRISAGISSVQLDLATATGSLLDASRFTLAVFQQLQASKIPVDSHAAEAAS